MNIASPTYTSNSRTWPRGLAVEVLIGELSRHGHGPITDEGPDWGGYLKVADAPSFTLSVEEKSDGQVEIEWQSGLEKYGHERVGKLGIMNLAAIAMELHAAIELHKTGLGLIATEKADAEFEVASGSDRLEAEFALDQSERVDLRGRVDHRRRARFEVTVGDLTEDEARCVLEALAANGLLGRSATGEPGEGEGRVSP